MMEERVDKWCPNHHSPCGITMVESNWQRFFIGVSIPNVTQVKPTDNVLWFFLQMAETIIMITLFKIMDKWMWWRTLWLPNFKGRLRARVVNQHGLQDQHRQKATCHCTLGHYLDTRGSSPEALLLFLFFPFIPIYLSFFCHFCTYTLT